MRFQGKVVLVTGASSGIGLATAEAFAAEGASVAVADKDRAAAARVAEQMRKGGADAADFGVELPDERQIQDLMEALRRRWGRIDVLVNNAGIYYQADVTGTPLAVWNEVLGVNLTGAFLCIKHAVPLMPAGSAIVNVASEAALVGIRGQVAYNVSKAALIGLTRSCAVDLAQRGIRVSCVCPGTTETPLVQAALARAADPAAARRALESARPSNRLGRPEEIAEAVLLLAANGYATGAVLSVDGGYTAQ